MVTSEGKSIRKLLLEWLSRPTRDTGTSDVFEGLAAVGTTIGNVRSENQDRAVIARLTNKIRSQQSLLICVVCDGMGGMIEGGRCAELATATFLDSMLALQTASDNALRNAVNEANSAVYEEYRGRGGTTLAAIVFGPFNQVTAITVGDTRVYGFSKSDGLRQISVDDTIAGELQRLGGTKPNISKQDDFSNRLAQFVGIGNDLEPRVYNLHDSKATDSYIISTDGIHGVAAATLEEIIDFANSRHTCVSRLVQLSRWCGGRDNASAIDIQSSASRVAKDTKQAVDIRLEVWDSFSKLDLALPSRAQFDRTIVERQYRLPVDESIKGELYGKASQTLLNQGETRRKKPKKLGNKESSSKQREKAERRTPQAELKIEIVDTLRSGEGKSDKSPSGE